jgi:hypothetical protein
LAQPVGAERGGFDESRGFDHIHRIIRQIHTKLVAAWPGDSLATVCWCSVPEGTMARKTRSINRFRRWHFSKVRVLVRLI